MMGDFFTTHLILLYEIGDVFIVFFLLILFAGALIARFDKLPFGKAIYFACITAFTVGLGDITPQSRGARIVTVFLAFLGLILMGVFVAVASQALDIAYEKWSKEAVQMQLGVPLTTIYLPHFA